MTRCSRLQIFFKIGVLKNFTKFSGKHLCWSLFLIKLQAFRRATLLKRDFQHRCFSCEVWEYFKNAFFYISSSNTSGCYFWMTEIEKEYLKQRGKLTKYYYRNGQKKDDHEKLLAKAVAHRCSVSKVLLQIPQNSQENTCARVADLRFKKLY